MEIVVGFRDSDILQFDQRMSEWKVDSKLVFRIQQEIVLKELRVNFDLETCWKGLTRGWMK